MPFIDSAGLGALIGGIRRIRELGGRVAISCPRAGMLRLFHTTGFDRIAPVAPSVVGAAELLYDDDLAATGTDG